jgi:hypothetical protein
MKCNLNFEELMRQIDWRELKMMNFKFIKDGEHTLRLNKGKKNLDISLNENDYYDVAMHTLKPNFECVTENRTDVFFEDLKEIISTFFKFEYVMHNFVRG